MCAAFKGSIDSIFQTLAGIKFWSINFSNILTIKRLESSLGIDKKSISS
jgi:hypothetical protein